MGWRKSSSSLVVGGRHISGLWRNDPYICYSDPALGWCISRADQVVRTLRIGSAALTVRGGACNGQPWWSGGGWIVYFTCGTWYALQSSVTPVPGYIPRNATVDYEDEDIGDPDRYWTTPGGAIDPFGDPDGEPVELFYRGLYSGHEENLELTYEAPGVTQRDDDGGYGPFGEYGEHWIGLPTWDDGEGHEVVQLAAGWRGAAEAGRKLILAGYVKDSPAGWYEADIPVRKQSLVFTWRAGDDDPDREEAPLTLAWQGYGSEDGATRTFELGVGEVAIWR